MKSLLYIDNNLPKYLAFNELINKPNSPENIHI